MATSYFKYGSYAHPQGEVNLSRFDIRPNYTARGKRYSITYIMHIAGEIIASGQAAVITRINELISAYSTNDLSAVLYDNTGLATPHILDATNPNAITPVQVIQRSWPKGGPEELANCRNFSITLSQEVLDTESGIYQYSDSLQFIGNAGAAYRASQYATGVPRLQQTNQYTIQRIIQNGYAIGVNGYVTPAALRFAPIAAIEHADQRRIFWGTPQYRGRSSIFYPCRWTYFYSTASDLSANVPDAV